MTAVAREGLIETLLLRTGPTRTERVRAWVQTLDRPEVLRHTVRLQQVVDQPVMLLHTLDALLSEVSAHEASAETSGSA